SATQRTSHCALRSHARTRTSWLPVASAMSRLAASARSWSCETSQSRAPWAARVIAVWRPSPLLPPVIITVLVMLATYEGAAPPPIGNHPDPLGEVPSGTVSDHTTQTAEVRNGVTIAYVREGTGGAPLLLLHGYPETKRIW